MYVQMHKVYNIQVVMLQLCRHVISLCSTFYNSLEHSRTKSLPSSPNQHYPSI